MSKSVVTEDEVGIADPAGNANAGDVVFLQIDGDYIENYFYGAYPKVGDLVAYRCTLAENNKLQFKLVVLGDEDD